MTSADTKSPTPIYDSLIDEHGDVPAEVRQAAEKANRDVTEALAISDAPADD